MHGLLLTEETVQTALTLVTALAHDTMGPGTVGAGVSIRDSTGRRTSSAATDDVVARADALQYELDEGPCLAAWAGRAVVRLDDTAADERWPQWAAAAAGLGLRSVLSAPLVAGDAALGAIKVYADRPGAYDERSQRLLSMFAGQAAVLLANVRTVQDARRLTDDLRQALHRRDVIAMAKGVLMASEQVAEDAAFALLVSVAQRDHRPLQDVAASVMAASVRGTSVVRAKGGDRRG
jgi:GAF domain-containing protein